MQQGEVPLEKHMRSIKEMMMTMGEITPMTRKELNTNMQRASGIKCLSKIVIELLEIEVINDMLDNRDLEKFQKFHYINRLNWKDWNYVCDTLSEEQLIKLIKSLTLVEKELQWIGGSVSSVIWIFKALERRGSLCVEEIADWVLRHTNNPYLPYGSHNMGAESLTDYKLYLDNKSERYSIHCLNAEIMKENSRERKKISRMKIEVQLIRQKEQSVNRKNMLYDLHNMKYCEKVSFLVKDEMHSVFYYPIDMFNYDIEVLKSLEYGLLKDLSNKLTAIKKGPWRVFLLNINIIILEEEQKYKKASLLK